MANNELGRKKNPVNNTEYRKKKKKGKIKKKTSPGFCIIFPEQGQFLPPMLGCGCCCF